MRRAAATAIDEKGAGTSSVLVAAAVAGRAEELDALTHDARELDAADAVELRGRRRLAASWEAERRAASLAPALNILRYYCDAAIVVQRALTPLAPGSSRAATVDSRRLWAPPLSVQ